MFTNLGRVGDLEQRRSVLDLQRISLDLHVGISGRGGPSGQHSLNYIGEGELARGAVASDIERLPGAAIQSIGNERETREPVHRVVVLSSVV